MLAKDCTPGRKRSCAEKWFERAEGERIKLFSVHILPSPTCSIHRLHITALNKFLNADLKFFILLHTFIKTTLRKIFSSFKYCGIFQKDVFRSPLGNNSSVSLREPPLQGKVMLGKGLRQQRFKALLNP